MSERLGKFSVRILTLVAGLYAAPALAQDFTAGKTAAQLFASDCAACHKSPGGLARRQTVSSLTSFLREHYTTKAASAAALAAYLANPANARPPAQAPNTGPKATEEKPAPKPRPPATATTEPDKQPEAEASAPAASRETPKPPVDPVVAKLNSYAAAGGEVIFAGKPYRLGPGDVGVIGSNELHNAKNVGTTVARYFIVNIGRDDV